MLRNIRKLFVSLAILLLAALLITACGKKDDLFLIDTNLQNKVEPAKQAQQVVDNPSDEGQAKDGQVTEDKDKDEPKKDSQSN